MSKQEVKAFLSAKGLICRESAAGHIIATECYTAPDGTACSIDTDLTGFTKAQMLWWLGY